MNDDNSDPKPKREYFILPPAYRPLAFALSAAVVALVIWDKTQTSPDIAAPRAGSDSEKVAVKTAAEAPPSIDVSGRLASSDELSDQNAKTEDAGKLEAASTLGKHISAPGKPLGIAEEKAPAAPAAEDKNGAFLARNEEERSAINERLYKGLEEEKKRMGIARILEKDGEEKTPPPGGRDTTTLQATPEAARVRAAPAVKALALKSAEALQAAWDAAGLPGEPPAVKFPGEMAVFLAGPAGCGIAAVQNRKKLIVILYKDSGFDDASARVRAVALSPKPVVVRLAQ